MGTLTKLSIHQNKINFINLFNLSLPKFKVAFVVHLAFLLNSAEIFPRKSCPQARKFVQKKQVNK